MDQSPDSIIAVAINSIILLFLSAVFSGAETAFTNLSPARVELIRKDGKFASRLIYRLYQKLDLLISLSLILSNGVNIFLATYLTIFFTGLFGVDLGGVLSATLGTILVIVFGEIVPKKYAILFPVYFSRATAHLLEFCRIIFFPVLAPILFINRAIDRFHKKNKEEHRRLMQAEIEATLGIGHTHGALEKKEYGMMRKLLLLNDRLVSEIMTRRNEVHAMMADRTLRDLVLFATKHNLSRIPIYNTSIDDIEFIIHTPQLNPHLLNAENWKRPIRDFCETPAFKVPESKILDDLFFEFQEKRIHMAVVLNEFGETSGIITLEDIIEQIFGDIEDETDAQEESITPIDHGAYTAAGDVSLEELEEVIGESFPAQYPRHKSISWLILDILHRFPDKGEIVAVPGTTIRIEVLDKEKELINSVKIVKTSQ